MKKSVVITTINKPNENIKKISNLCLKDQSDFIIIGDKKTPKNFIIKYGNYYGIKSQEKLKFQFSKVCKKNNYARKNIGYLISMKNKSKVIIETDDDNFPKDNFIKNIKLKHKVKQVKIKNNDWVNIYNIFTVNNKKSIWPRGLPLNKIDEIPKLSNKKKSKNFYLQQGVCEGNPDVDALYRILNKKINVKFKKNYSVDLGKAFSPTNSQNTIWFNRYFPLMYLPSTCEMRVTDIWRGIIALNIIIKDRSSILFFGTTMKQIRNIHDLTDDLKQEFSLYKNLEKGLEKLKKLKLDKGNKNYLKNLLVSYKALIKEKIFNPNELKYLYAWIDDIKKLN